MDTQTHKKSHMLAVTKHLSDSAAARVFYPLWLTGKQGVIVSAVQCLITSLSLMLLYVIQNGVPGKM